jgi:hypothetical protein
MNRTFLRRSLPLVGTAAMLTLAAGPALAAPGGEPGPAEHAAAHERADRADHPKHDLTEDTDGDSSNDPDHEFGESLHPSGRDGTDHQDKRQGNAQSDPDDDGRGMDRNGTGLDQPGEDGGVYTDDQDGNNGCGNDQDFEDDNNGWCGKPDFAGPPADEDDVVVDEDEDVDEDDLDTDDDLEEDIDIEEEVDREEDIEVDVIVDVTDDRDDDDSISDGGATDVTAVLGDVMATTDADTEVMAAADTTIAAAPDALAVTGLPLSALALAAFGAVGAGAGMRRLARD